MGKCDTCDYNNEGYCELINTAIKDNSGCSGHEYGEDLI